MDDGFVAAQVAYVSVNSSDTTSATSMRSVGRAAYSGRWRGSSDSGGFSGGGGSFGGDAPTGGGCGPPNDSARIDGRGAVAGSLASVAFTTT